MNNVQFATAVHILTLLAFSEDSLSSAYMAGSMNVDPSVVRRSLSVLNAKGLVVTKEGKRGGSTLAKAADKILLSDVYKAVNDTSLLGRLNTPNPDCTVGKQINGHLTKLYQHADDALIAELGTITLADFTRQFN
jgi:Rrf2 family protein